MTSVAALPKVTFPPKAALSKDASPITDIPFDAVKKFETTKSLVLVKPETDRPFEAVNWPDTVTIPLSAVR